MNKKKNLIFSFKYLSLKSDLFSKNILHSNSFQNNRFKTMHPFQHQIVQFLAAQPIQYITSYQHQSHQTAQSLAIPYVTDVTPYQHQPHEYQSNLEYQSDFDNQNFAFNQL